MRATTEPLKVIRPAVNASGKISAASMVVALAKSGIPLEGIALYKTMTAEDQAAVRAALD